MHLLRIDTVSYVLFRSVIVFVGVQLCDENANRVSEGVCPYLNVTDVIERYVDKYLSVCIRIRNYSVCIHIYR